MVFTYTQTYFFKNNDQPPGLKQLGTKKKWGNENDIYVHSDRLFEKVCLSRLQWCLRILKHTCSKGVSGKRTLWCNVMSDFCPTYFLKKYVWVYVNTIYVYSNILFQKVCFVSRKFFTIFELLIIMIRIIIGWPREERTLKNLTPLESTGRSQKKSARVMCCF